MRKVYGSLCRNGKVRRQTPKVEKQEKKKEKRGRAKRRKQAKKRFGHKPDSVVGRLFRKGPNWHSGRQHILDDEIRRLRFYQRFQKENKQRSSNNSQAQKQDENKNNFFFT